MTVLEHIKQLSQTLTPDQREELAHFLIKPNGRKSISKKPVSLRGSWKIDSADDFDIDTALREIRDEWKKELDFDL